MSEARTYTTPGPTTGTTPPPPPTPPAAPTAGFALTPADRTRLRGWARGSGARALRAQIVLDASAGTGVIDSARRLGVSRPTVTTWRRRYAAEGLAGLEHRPRSGRPSRVDEAALVARSLLPAPDGEAPLSVRALAARTGVSHTTLAAVRRRWGLGAGPGTAGLTVPADPPCPLRDLDLLAVRARHGHALFLLGEPPEGRPRPSRRATALVRDATAYVYGALDALDTAEGPEPPPESAPPAYDDLLEAVRARHPGRTLHALTLGPAPAPEGTRPHTLAPATRALSLLRVLLLAELARDPVALAAALTGPPAADVAAEGPLHWVRPPAPPTAQSTPRPAPRAFNQLALGSYNEKLVIESIREAGTLSRVEIAASTGLTPQAVSRITRNLLTSGLIVQDEGRSAGAGKPRIPLRLRPDAGYAVGIHLDPWMITAVAVDLCGQVVARRRMPLEAPRDPDWCLAQMAALAREAAAEVPDGGPVLGYGAALPGPLDRRAGVLLDPPLFEGWDRVDVGAKLSARLGSPVVVEKDATAAAIGERWLGAAERAEDFVYLYLGAGAGSGAFLNGDVHRGATGNAGELGELCAPRPRAAGDDDVPRSAEECAPISTTLARVRAAGLPVPRGEDAYPWVCARAAEGDPAVREVVDGVARVLARGAAGLVGLFDTELLIVGGPAVLPGVRARYLDVITAAVNTFPLAHHVRTVRVAPSHLGEEAAAVGAASSVFHATFTPSLKAGRRARN
ncbi:ROK family protein [Streptomyces sp. GZWMJZ-114]|uniref:ROK family protein n=1 Tax=Streptomyces sp. GZWMJZ-114 TaxID=2494734 RepID=UPI0010127B05|nr:ROK family protein [Streptomyces sp. GZWMJZ-114]